MYFVAIDIASCVWRQQQLEAYWDSSYVIPPNRSCMTTERGERLYEESIDIWRNVPWEFRKPGLTINIAFADYDLDRWYN